MLGSNLASDCSVLISSEEVNESCIIQRGFLNCMLNQSLLACVLNPNCSPGPALKHVNIFLWTLLTSISQSCQVFFDLLSYYFEAAFQYISYLWFERLQLPFLNCLAHGIHQLRITCFLEVLPLLLFQRVSFWFFSFPFPLVTQHHWVLATGWPGKTCFSHSHN